MSNGKPNRSSRAGFRKTTLDVPDDLNAWIEEQIERHIFRDRTQAILACIRSAKENGLQWPPPPPSKGDEGKEKEKVGR